MNQNEINANVNFTGDSFATMGSLMTQMDVILNLAQLSHYDYIYIGLEAIKKMSAYELALIEDLKHSPFKTEFEPEPDKRSFFKMLEDKIKLEESVLLFSVALPYPTQTLGLNKSLGVIEGSSWYYDYHCILRERMNIANVMFSKIDGIKVKETGCFVDTSEYIDRELAFLCGLGNYGKNQMLIHPDLGTQFHIGHMYIILRDRIDPLFSKIESETELDKRRVYGGCQNCDKCVKACPVGICGTSQMNRSKCISYLTQTKKELVPEEMKIMHNRLYGCDVCQNVCPANHIQHRDVLNLSDTGHWQLNDFKGIELLETLGLSQRAFKRQYGDRGFAWRGVKIFKRNALIAIGNSGDNSFYKKLEAFSELKEDSFLQPYYEYALEGTKFI